MIKKTSQKRIISKCLLVGICICALSIRVCFAEDSLSFTPKHLEEALQGNAESQYHLARIFEQREEYQEAVEWYKRSAEQGYVKAQYSIGLRYYRGEGVPLDYEQAAKWYKKAAKQGYVDAQYNLGLLYDQGKGVPQDSALALKWYIKAGEQGDIDAQYNIAHSYSKGEGIDQDYLKAAIWFRKAAAQGDVASQKRLSLFYALGKGVQKNGTEAYAWALIAALNGDAEIKKICENSLWPEQIVQGRTRSKELVSKFPYSVKNSQNQHVDLGRGNAD